MSNDPSHSTTYSASDGRTWVEPMPEHAQRELDACRAIDILQHQIDRAQEPRQAAEATLAAATANTAAEQLLAEWAHHTAALTAAIDELVKAGDRTIQAVRRAFWLE